jgi:hypothetical protein
MSFVKKQKTNENTHPPRKHHQRIDDRLRWEILNEGGFPRDGG